MADETHSPGPWMVDFVPLIGHVVRDGYGAVIARCASREDAFWMSHGNYLAKIEGESKELLAALKEVMSVSDRKTDIYDRARALIARIEGK